MAGTWAVVGVSRESRNFAAAMWMLILTAMGLGFGAGWTLRRGRLSLDGLTGPLVWLLLFLLGAEVGANEAIVAALPRLGGWAVALALATAVGSAAAAWCVARWAARRKGGGHDG